jgi:uncharacterized membrane protein YozB (DUF420 family)
LNEGFLRTSASGGADLVLLLEIAMGVGLLIGAWLARRKRYRQHAWCQAVIVILNAALIALTMIPAFRVQVLPRIPEKLGRGFYGLATTHAVFGSVTEVAGLYLLLAAGTRVLPPKLRLTRYKAWMRTVLALWYVVLILGMATYARWYIPALFRK